MKDKLKIIVPAIILLLLLGGYFIASKVNNNNSKNISKIANEQKSSGDFEGTIREIQGEYLSVEKVKKKNLGNNRFVSGGKGEMVKVKINENTKFILRNTSDQGKTYADRVSDKSEVKTGRFITVSGKNNGDNIVAEKMIILKIN